MWYQTKFFIYTVGIIMVLTILYLILLLSPILNTIFEFIVTLVTPLFIGGLIFYIVRPIRDYLESKKIPRIYAIAFIYCLVLAVLALVLIYLWPFFKAQIEAFNESPEKFEEVQNKTMNIINLFNIYEYSTEDIKKYLIGLLHSFFNWVVKDLTTIVGRVTQIAGFVIFTPIILFYLLKDSNNFPKIVLHATPKEYKQIVGTLLEDLDSTLSLYISGQFVVAVIDASLIFLGYLIVGLPFALLLAMIALVFNMIPFVGTFISTIPALIVGFAISPYKSLEVLAIVIIVHTLDANIISPYILGGRLKVHPLTIILLLLACGSLYGILGLLLATPIYVIIKVLINDLYIENENL